MSELLTNSHSSALEHSIACLIFYLYLRNLSHNARRHLSNPNNRQSLLLGRLLMNVERLEEFLPQPLYILFSMRQLRQYQRYVKSESHVKLQLTLHRCLLSFLVNILIEFLLSAISIKTVKSPLLEPLCRFPFYISRELFKYVLSNDCWNANKRSDLLRSIYHSLFFSASRYKMICKYL